jgi:hypothetical protein
MYATRRKERSTVETNEIMKTAAHRSESWCWRQLLFCLMSWCLSWRSWCAAALRVTTFYRTSDPHTSWTFQSPLMSRRVFLHKQVITQSQLKFSSIYSISSLREGRLYCVLLPIHAGLAEDNAAESTARKVATDGRKLVRSGLSNWEPHLLSVRLGRRMDEHTQ